MKRRLLFAAWRFKRWFLIKVLGRPDPIRYEANMSWKMDYVTGVHRPWKPKDSQ